jgi:hypothetical protein
MYWSQGHTGSFSTLQRATQCPPIIIGHTVTQLLVLLRLEEKVCPQYILVTRTHRLLYYIAKDNSVSPNNYWSHSHTDSCITKTMRKKYAPNNCWSQGHTGSCTTLSSTTQSPPIIIGHTVTQILAL